MNRPLSINPAWWELIRISARQITAYRLDILVAPFAFAVQLYVTRAVWESVYAGRNEVDGVTADTLLVYLTVSSFTGWFMPRRAGWTIQERVLSGDIALDLVRPFHYLKQLFAQDVGTVASYLPLLVTFVPAALIVGSLDPPSPLYLALYFLSFGLAFLVNFLIDLQLGMLAFWMQSINGLRVMIIVAGNFLSGALVPLWLMPDGARWIFQLLPFQALAFLPASIYTGQTTGSAALRPLAIQMIWIAILFLTTRFTWYRAQQRIVVHGG
jgi:ABC-type uncharacterized transport system permease subunit